MPARRVESPCASAAVAVALLWGLLWCAGGASAAGAEQPAAPPPFQRAEAAVIQSTVRSILADPRYAPRQTFWQWLGQQLSSWKGPDLRLPHALASALSAIFIVWCVAALLAILAHMIWTLATLYRSQRLSPGRVAGLERFGGGKPLSYEELLGRMRALAGKGAYREALGAMMLALLWRLDAARLVAFHPSKTNGDYVRDYPPFRPGSGDFRRFASAFDAIVYGGVACGPELYGRMKALFERVRGDVEKEPQG
jgi:Domain of unknown function (DUF4129)